MCSSQLLHLVFCLRNGNLQDYCVTVQCHKNANLRSSNLDLAPSSELRYLGRSASRQSSLPINRDCQQTATNYLLYQSRAYTRSTTYFLRFTSSSNDILKSNSSCSAWYLARCLGASGIHQSRCTRRTRNCCCPDPALAARTQRSTQENQLLGVSVILFPVRSSCCLFFLSVSVELFPACSS